MANTTGKKYGGRKQGVPNQLTQELREKLNMFINDNYDLFLKDYNELGAKDRVNVFIKLFQTALPKTLEVEEYKPTRDIIIEGVKWAQRGISDGKN